MFRARRSSAGAVVEAGPGHAGGAGEARATARPALPRLLLLAAYAWLAWHAAYGLAAGWRAPRGVLEVLRTPADERIDAWLGPLGVELRARIERETPREARVFVVIDEFHPSAQQLYARLLVTCFPRVMLTLLADRLGELAPGDFVLLLQPELASGLPPGARRIAGDRRYALWAIER